MAALLTDLSRQERIGPGEVSEAYVTSLLSALGCEVATRASRSAESALAPRAVSTASAQPESLSEREIEILRLIALGCSNREIADRLVLAVSTVKWYVNTIYGKLQVDSRTRAVARARGMSLISD
jgi:LuxR family maltose regulon positive regulatory protein